MAIATPSSRKAEVRQQQQQALCQKTELRLKKQKCYGTYFVADTSAITDPVSTILKFSGVILAFRKILLYLACCIFHSCKFSRLYIYPVHMCILQNILLSILQVLVYFSTSAKASRIVQTEPSCLQFGVGLHKIGGAMTFTMSSDTHFCMDGYLLST